ncbi:MAG TPA: hypothetical protein VLF62_06325 [Candidatus Saccharimonadales bacterium]|nr:hypothetical protein [Candidatus Saccharimonadales bacterium]
MKQPDPSAATVALWLKNISRGELHEQGWITINKRFHGIARAARPYLQAQFTDEQDQEAAFDGFTLALMAVAHFEDVAHLSTLFTTDGASELLAESTKELKHTKTTEPAKELPEPHASDDL